MSFEVKTHGRIGPALQRVAAKELEAARRHLESFRDGDVTTATHEARKHLKKIRAIVRMLRDTLGEEKFAVENVCYRDAGRRLRDLRDAQVLVQQLDRLRERFFNARHPAVLSHARRLLHATEERCRGRLTSGQTIACLLKEIEAAEVRTTHWQLDAFGWKEARGAIRRSYRQARRAFRRASDEPQTENLHEWRKRAKDLWYQAGLLRRACPVFMERFVRDLEVLTEIVGEDHDVSVLQEALRKKAKVLKHPRELAIFCEMTDLRRRELVSAAFDLGESVFASAAGDFARELDDRRTARRQLARKTKELAPRLRSPR